MSRTRPAAGLAAGVGVLVVTLMLLSPAGAQPTTPAPPTNPACVYSTTDFAYAFLNEIPAPTSSNNVQSILAWEMAEGGNWKNTAHYNPLNTTLQYDNSVNFNTGQPGSGVQSFNSWDDGTYATTYTLVNGAQVYNFRGYQQILTDLSNSAPPQQTTNDIDNSAWGTSNAASFVGDSYNPSPQPWDTPCTGISAVFTETANGSMAEYWPNPAGWETALIAAPGSLYSSPSVAIGSNGSDEVAVEGPQNSLWTYWTSGSNWYGPIGLGAPGVATSQPAVTVQPNGTVEIVTWTSSGALWSYWNVNNTWNGPLGLGAGYSAPAMAASPAGPADVAVEGLHHSLWLYWQLQSGQWVGPLGVGAPGSTFSTPTIAYGPTGLPEIAVEGPSNTLWLYWETPDAQWHGPLGVGAPGSTYSSPSLAYGPNGLPDIAVQGPSDTLWLYWETSDAQWHGPLGVGNARSTFSAPSLTFGSGGLPTIAAEGPSATTWAYWEQSNAQWAGPIGPGPPGSSAAAPFWSSVPQG